MSGANGKMSTDQPRVSSTDRPEVSSSADRASSPAISVSSPTGSTHRIIKFSSHGSEEKPLNLSDHDPEGKPITNALNGHKKKSEPIKRRSTTAFELETPITNLGAFPSLEDLTAHYSKIFKMIESRDYSGVETFLAEKGIKVEIVPKVGCSQMHYSSTFNVANLENELGDSPLIMAAKVDSRMVKIILKYGGNPNHTNEDRDSPLSIAAVRGDRESIDVLLLSGANLTAAVAKITSYLRYQTELTDTMASGFESGFSVKSLTFLLSNNVYLKCRDPFRTAFDVSSNIEDIVNVRDEFRMEFELLMKDADVFAYKMLDHCDKMWEAREVLDRSHGLLRRAIDEGKKRFVAHPFSQQIILEEWYGKVAFKMTFGKIKIVFRYLLSPLLLPLYLLHFLCMERCKKVSLMDSRVAEHMKLLFTPFLCFITDVINYLILLFLLIAACVVSKSCPTPHWVEFTLWACTVSRFLIELDQMAQQGLWRYLPNMWNFLELSSCVVITVAATYRIVIWRTYDSDCKTELDEVHTHILNITYMYAMTEFFLILRWLNFLEFFPSLGPLLIALRYLIADVFKFVMIVLLTCVIGSTIAVYSITSTISLHVGDAEGPGVKEVPTYFIDLKSCFKNIMWSTFGLLEMPEIKVENDDTSTNVIHGILVLYILLACVLMLNMLIALLNNTFERIQDNCDIEWKYARSEQLKEYRNGQPFLFPFHFFLLPVMYWFRCKIDAERYSIKRDTHESEMSAEDGRDKLLSALCDRYARSHDDTAYDLMYGYDYGRRDTFTEAAAVQRHRRSGRKELEALNDAGLTQRRLYRISECTTSTTATVVQSSSLSQRNGRL